ncbi:hypothetical protein DFJ58DRAFT_843167 [Suillus subalutaceus]|uniref:uncharacterized protein n=1 Tax=Suillus subalutaceus TaxID=48586 RepID=UPI001B87F3A6|nr:uncharacterized protein DFJ58DRAFT_843167 [Suillus subalutaceus]KAG1847528.1 hypothetical protein DFJ58DRAFT_843167 [Suillus subalutaceus]
MPHGVLRTRTYEHNSNQYTYLQAENSNYDRQKIERCPFLKAFGAETHRTSDSQTRAKLDIASAQIDGSKGLLGIVPSIDGRNANRPKSGLYSHTTMIGDSSRHIASMQKRQRHSRFRFRIINTNSSWDIDERSEDFIRRHK